MLDSIYHIYDIKTTLKSHFCRKNLIILSLCTQHCYGRHNVSRKSVNHSWFIDFIAWCYFTPTCDVIIMIKNLPANAKSKFAHCFLYMGNNNLVIKHKLL